MRNYSPVKKAGVVSIEQLPSLNKNLEMGSGRFGVLYSDPRDPLRCIKKLKTPLRGLEAEKLNRLVDLARWARPSDVHHLLTRFAWPIETFGNGREIDAYTMPKAPQSCYFDMTIVSRLADRSRPGAITESKRDRREPLQLKYLIDDSWWQGRQVSSRKPEVDEEQRIDIAIDCCDSLLVLHSHGLVYGDISANNIVARRETFAGAFFFDADSISSVEFRAAESLVSPGWETPAGLDPLAIDRSRCALVVLRLLTERLNARPDDDPGTFTSSYIVSTLLPVLKACYQRGDESTFLELVRTLRSLRSIPHGDEVFTHAVEIGYARLVLREQVHARTSSQQVVIEQAKSQIAFEEQVDQTTGLEHRRLVRRARIRAGHFKLDSSPRLELLRELSSDSDLMELIYEAQFQDIVNHLVASGLATLENHPAVLRVVEHAHLEIDLPSPRIAAQPGKAEIEVEWPREEFVNSARLRIRTGNDLQDMVVERKRGESRIVRVVSAPRGTDLQVSVVFGSRSKSGLDYFPSFGRSLNANVPPIPAPARPVVSSSQTNVSQPVRQDLDVVIFDPDAERREQERLEREAAQLRRRRFTISAAVVLLVAMAVGIFLVVRPDDGLVSLTPEQQSYAPLDWGQTTFGPDLVSAEKTSRNVTFFWPERLIDWEYSFQSSYDGVRWTRPQLVESSSSIRSLSLDYPGEGTPPLHLVQIKDVEGKVRARQFINLFYATGFNTYPRFEVTPEGVEVEIDPAELTGNPLPTAFVVEGISQVGNWERSTYQRRTSSTSVLVPQPDAGALTSVRVRAVFGPGQFGQWVGIDL